MSDTKQPDKQRKNWMLLVPAEMAERCEAIAAAERRATGSRTAWSEIARKAIERGLRGLKHRQ